MPPKRYPHLVLPGPSDKREDYSSPRRGGSAPHIKPQNRKDHAAALEKELNAAWQETNDRKVVAKSSRDGAYLQFSSEPGFDLVIKSLEAVQSGVRLLNVRQEKENGADVTRATVFVPQSKSSHFLKKVTEYATNDNRPKKDGTSTPKNGPLVESIGSVRAAIVEKSFWQGNSNRLPGDTPDWIEVWLASEDLNAIAEFESVCQSLNIRLGEGRLNFPERTVRIVLATNSDLEALIEHSDSIAEFRPVPEVATFFIEEENRDQIEWAEQLLQQTEFDDQDNIAVLILDRGVNNGHMLLSPILEDEDCHAADPAWGTADDNGHGTLMAGTAGYGDILEALDTGKGLQLKHILESAKILPPTGSNLKELWGHFTARGIAEAEIQAPERKRVICMAITSPDDLERGVPSSWSGEIDQLASGAIDDLRRLIIISAGNVEEPEDWKRFPEANLTCEVEDPAHAWNAISVGAATEKTLIKDESLSHFHAIAEAGDISPYSTTTVTWPKRKWPIKPEIVIEGGNIAQTESGSVFDTEDLKLLSTYYRPAEAQFAPFFATSIASAQAAWMAARIQSEYQEFWPETVRALLVHSAEWTETQKRKYLHGDTKSDYYELTKICGYGVPNLERALSCAGNSLSLIAQAELQPFAKHETASRYVTKDMHLYELPWPTDVLTTLGEVEIQMNVTLSYFIEPSPGRVGWKDRYRYASHALRFELNGPGESQDEFVQRINSKAREDDEHPGTEGAGDHWTIGEARNVGSIHSDIWTGTAADLALSNIIAVHPAVGWWRERHHLNKFDKLTRYSLVVSFSLPDESIDIYTPIALQLGIPTPVEIQITV
ncbi:MAG: S8 family peptidase [Verrucomicrobiales bacterium]|nr:S8 family peptidase [Verrucomicrobiales bacterium]